MFSNRIWVLLYVLLALVYLWADASGIQSLVYTTKPALVSILLVYFVVSVRRNFNPFSLTIITGLIFAIAGDTFLLLEGDLYFMLGLGSFLLTHIFYARAFLNAAPRSLAHFFSFRKIAFFCFFLLLLSLMLYLWPDLGALRWPVLVYGTAITMMGFTAFNLRGAVSRNIFLLLFTGALLFIFSDSMIAIDKFKSSQLNLPFPRLLIMVPYILAQYMIVAGSIGINNYDHSENKS